MEGGRVTGLEVVPNEMLDAIFHFLSPKDLIACAQVCKSWSSVSLDENRWVSYFASRADWPPTEEGERKFFAIDGARIFYQGLVRAIRRWHGYCMPFIPSNANFVHPKADLVPCISAGFSHQGEGWFIDLDEDIERCVWNSLKFSSIPDKLDVCEIFRLLNKAPWVHIATCSYQGETHAALLTASGRVEVWNLERNTSIHGNAQLGKLQAVSLLACGDHLQVAGHSQTLGLFTWNLIDKPLIVMNAELCSWLSVCDLSRFPLAVATLDEKIRLWDAEHGLRQFHLGFCAALVATCPEQGLPYVTVCDAAGTRYLVNTDSGEVLSLLFNVPPGRHIQQMQAFNFKGSHYVVVGDADGKIEIEEFFTGYTIYVAWCTGSIMSVRVAGENVCKLAIWSVPPSQNLQYKEGAWKMRPQEGGKYLSLYAARGSISIPDASEPPMHQTTKRSFATRSPCKSKIVKRSST